MSERDDVIADLRTRLAAAEAQVAAAQTERDMTRAMAAERAALRADLAAAKEQRDEAMEVLTRFGNVDKAAEIASLVADLAEARQALAAAEEQLADANRGYSLLCDEEARLNDDLAAARRALERMLRYIPRGPEYSSLQIAAQEARALATTQLRGGS